MIDDQRQLTRTIIRNISKLIYENDMLNEFIIPSMSSYLVIENIEDNWNLFESKFETNELGMQTP